LYILSCVVHKFFFHGLVLPVDEHFDLAFFRTDHHRLAAHAADHVKRIHRPTPKSQLQGVLLDAFFQRLLQRMLDLEKPIGRAQAPDALVGALVVVVLDPKRRSLHGLLEAVELCPLEELVQDRFPKPFDLAQRHRMMGAGADVLDAVLFHLFLEAGLAAPVRILPAIVGEHLFGNAIFGDTAAVGLQDMGCGLTAIKPQAGDIPGVVVNITDQIGVLTTQPESHYVALPQLVGA